MGIKVITGLVHRPQKVVIYGPEGIGKTTLASDFPVPLFIDTEGGTSHMNVCRADWGSTWDDLMTAVQEVVKNKKELGIETLVIDTADWAEQLCVQHILKKYNVNGIENFGYGKGYTYIGEEFAKLLKECDKAIDAGINVVITAHAKMRKFEQPDELGAYDRWEMKLSKQVAPLVKEWCDMLLFGNYETKVVTVDKSGTKKPQGGKRVIYTSHHPCWDAKNRHGLPDKIDMTYYGPIQKAIEGPPKDTRPEPVIPEETPEPKKEKKQPKASTKKKEPEKEPEPEIPAVVKELLMDEEEEEHPPIEFGTPLNELKYKAALSGIDLGDIQKACVKTKMQPETKFVEEYDPDFIQKMLLDKWDSFRRFIEKNIKK